MKKKNLYALLLILCSINSVAQWSPYDRPSISTYTPLSPTEIMMPAMIMRQRHDAMAKNINDLVMYINNLKIQTTDAKFNEAMDGYLGGLRNLSNTLETRGVNAVNENIITQVYNGIQNDINNYNRRISDPEGYRREQEAEAQRMEAQREAEAKRMEAQRMEEERRLQARKAEEQARERALIERKESYDYYLELAYQSLRNNKRTSFLSYSDKALSCGWYSAKLYYDRGIAYRDLGETSLAREELKKAQKNGFPISNSRIKRTLKQ